MHTKTKSRGSIIAFSLIVLSFILTSGLAVVTVASLERKSGLITQKSVVAFQAADSGAERVLERIYIDNSPSLMVTPKDGTMPDSTLQQVATNLLVVTGGATCDGSTDKIVATSSSTPAYTFEVTFYDGAGTIIDCTDATWRDKAIRLKVEGFYRQTARVIELGIKPRPKCDVSDTVTDASGNNYDLIQIGDQCWMQQNMRVGTRIGGGTLQTDNGTIEHYCYDDDPSNCTTNHPNEPDGGLYYWNEAMQYETDERSQGICPDGFHIPTDEEWDILENYLDPTVGFGTGLGYRGTDIGTKLMPGGSSGFEGNLSGSYHDTGPFFRGRNAPLVSRAYFWSSSMSSANEAWIRFLLGSQSGSGRAYAAVDGTGSFEAISVRCLANDVP
ncbi:MAG: hypothetical protein E6R05_01225 [Candidatus Moraniibacteriota bacterium]|nr:MAG: hypothetical protein E6R05_01225 [Candidatus Moranbacteria bacterium]